MRPLDLSDVVELESYAELRPDYRRSVIAHKKSRRMAVGDRVTLLFEDRETLRFQVQEMLFVERIEDPDRVRDELDVYNELMPGEGELSATLFVEITDASEIRPELDRLIGLDEHVVLELGEGDDAVRIRARFDTKQLEEDRLSAVQYIRFRLDEEAVRRLVEPATRAAIRIEHPAYRREAELPSAVRASLAAGLRGEPRSLLPAGAPRRAPDVLIAEGPRVRLLRRPGSPSQEHLVVEARVGQKLDAELWTELLDSVRLAAEEVAARHGRARIRADWSAEAGAMRWHVVSVDRGG